MDINFSGRPDGLGNRVEEIILLDAICTKEIITANYVWNNQVAHRSYDILLTSENVNLNKKGISNTPFKMFKDLSSVNPNQHEILKSAKNIKPTFDIHFENDVKPVGIHMRGTDRIKNNNHPHFMRDEKEFFEYISKVITLINQKKPKYIYICSDEEDYKSHFINNLGQGITVIHPIAKKNIPKEYIDFFALSLCQEVYMCSKFSSFVITASMIGNIPLISLTQDHNVANRYKALFHYELDVKITENIKFNALQQKMIIKRLIKWCKNLSKRIIR
jgi:hypothetical protein